MSKSIGLMVGPALAAAIIVAPGSSAQAGQVCFTFKTDGPPGHCKSICDTFNRMTPQGKALQWAHLTKTSHWKQQTISTEGKSNELDSLPSEYAPCEASDSDNYGACTFMVCGRVIPLFKERPRDAKLDSRKASEVHVIPKRKVGPPPVDAAGSGSAMDRLGGGTSIKAGTGSSGSAGSAGRSQVGKATETTTPAATGGAAMEVRPSRTMDLGSATERFRAPK